MVYYIKVRDGDEIVTAYFLKDLKEDTDMSKTTGKTIYGTYAGQCPNSTLGKVWDVTFSVYEIDIVPSFIKGKQCEIDTNLFGASWMYQVSDSNNRYVAIEKSTGTLRLIGNVNFRRI